MSSNVQNICLSIYLSFQIVIITIIIFFKYGSVLSQMSHSSMWTQLEADSKSCWLFSFQALHLYNFLDCLFEVSFNMVNL